MSVLTVEFALHAACAAAVAALALGLCLPMLRKPLSEDEGNWFYLAVLADQGERMHGTYSAFGYFNLPLAARLAARLAGRADARFLQGFKICWYALTAASVYALAFALLGDRAQALAAGACFAVALGCGNTLFMLSYAEHYSILWTNLALVCALAGLDQGSLAPCAGAGLFAGLAVQFKPSGLLFAGALPLALLAHAAPAGAVGVYALAFAGLQLLPLALLPAQGLRTQAYVRDTLRATLRDGSAAAARLLGLRLPGALGGAGLSDYVGNRHDHARGRDLDLLRANVLPCLKDLRLLAVLALGRAAWGVAGLSRPELLLLALAGVHLLAQQMQKNYYTPHFNPIWAPVAILAGAALPGLAALVPGSGPAGWALGALLGWEALRLGLVLRREWAPGAELRFGFLHPVVGRVFDLARTAGEAIRAAARPDDRLCVWGDQPSVYLYARLRSFRAKEMFFYGHHGRLTRELWIIEALRERPPEHILFFNWKVADGWDMAAVAGRIGHVYAPAAVFELRGADGAVLPGPHGRPCAFPLWRRDDARYEQTLLERMQSCADGPRARALLAQLLDELPDSFEGRFWQDAPPGDGGAADARAVRKRAAALLGAAPAPAEAAALRLALARVAWEGGDPALAARELDLVPADAPCRARAMVLSGTLLLAQGRTGAAMRAFEGALELQPFSPGALNGIGECHLAAGRAREARDGFEHALRFMPAHRRAADNLDALNGGSGERIRLFKRLGVRGYWQDGDPVSFS
ncbi:tetratricopeptide repeat protein [Desulfocurvus sp.]|uniref:tetratricopeptide repeat protein n=1 Tax=Desulfocurvus sp. TaxID=2871698 RepID=UPI0025B821FC|nr:tetratricopeptide repeat protein [Desulfocurvus sp.]MCK9238799.1 tetratricopeptide repeat protein [Desulfocurvus sp.]